MAAAPPAAPASYSPRRFALAVTALVLGGFAIGTTEFVSMGLVPQIAAGLDASVPAVGHTISAYALGVVIGAPVFAVLGARRSRKALLLAFMAIFVLGNLASAAAASQELLLGARFLSGLPHGAYFGVAALVAIAMAPPNRAGRAVSLVMLGIPLANIAGVPLGTYLGQEHGWRSSYLLVAALGVLTLVAVSLVVPRIVPAPGATMASELRGLARRDFWLTFTVGAIGFGGLFALYSYIALTLTEVTGTPERTVPLFLLAFGVGGVVGTPIAGRLADWSVRRAVAIGLAGNALLLALFPLAAQHPSTAMLGLFLVAATSTMFVVPLQLRLMDAAGESRSLGAASNHAALNLANALGAWLGGLVIAAGWGYLAPSMVGAALAVIGLGLLGYTYRSEDRREELRARA